MRTFEVYEAVGVDPSVYKGTDAFINETGDLEIHLRGVVDGWLGTDKLVAAYAKGAWIHFCEVKAT